MDLVRFILGVSFQVEKGSFPGKSPAITCQIAIRAYDSMARHNDGDGIAADSAAYDTHDADDALELGLLSLDELLELSLWRDAAARVERRYTALTPDELRRAVLHELLDWEVNDLLCMAGARLAEAEMDSSVAVCGHEPVIVPSRALAEQKRELEEFLHDLRPVRHSCKGLIGWKCGNGPVLRGGDGL